MKIQDYGLISLEWIEAAINQMKREQKQELPCKATAIHILETLKKQLISPMPLCEKILNEGVDIGFVCTKDSIFNESIAKTFKDKFLNSDITI